MNRCDQWLEQYYGKLSFADYALLDRAARTLEENSTGHPTYEKFPWEPELRGIKPSNNYFGGVWNWDAAFHAMAVRRWDPELARDQIRLHLKIQRPDGKFPDVWRIDGSIFDGGSKPPVLPWAAWEIEAQEHDAKFLEAAYAGFVKNERFWMEKRGGAADGLCHYDGDSADPEERKLWGGWESGWDNSPRWDAGVTRVQPVDLNCYLVVFYRALAAMARRLGKGAETAAWKEKAETLAGRVEETFWDDARGCYYDFDRENRRFCDTVSPAAFMPLFIGTAAPERAARMAEVAQTHFAPGWPSVSYRDPAFEPTGYWRGRTWLNIAYFALKGLKDYGFTEIAEQGRDTLMSWVRRLPGSIYENYNPETGAPVGAPHFGWSSAFVIKFILDWDKPSFPAAD